MSPNNYLEAMKQLFTPFKKVPCQKISAVNEEKRMNFRTAYEFGAACVHWPGRLSTRVTPMDLARVWFADEKMFAFIPRTSVSGCAVQSRTRWHHQSMKEVTESTDTDASHKSPT